MSTVNVSLGRARSSSQVQLTGSAPPWIEKVHSSSGVCGVGPAERTGKSSVRYWPGGTRSGGPSRRLPLKPRETITATTLSACGQPCHRRRHAFELADGLEAAVGSDRPAEDALGVGVDRVEEAPVARDPLVADSGLAHPGRASHRLEQLDRAALTDRVAGDRPVAEVGDEDEAAVPGRRGPADLAARVRDRG